MGSFVLPVTVRSVAAARTILHQILHKGDPRPAPVEREETAATAALLVSELVTNAVRHTRSVLQLEIRIDDGTLLVAVTDDAPDPPVLRVSDHQALDGRGMQIVDALTDRWGVTTSGDHKIVWFQLDLL